MLFQIKKYLQFLWHSTNQHGVHSPFVFAFVTKCLYDKNSHPQYAVLKKYRQSLLQNKEKIKVNEFGAGSRVFKSDLRQVSKIATHAGASLKRMKLLYRVVNYFKPDTILELGTSLGLATAALSSNNTAKTTTLEGCRETAHTAQKELKKLDFIENTEFIINDFNQSFKSLGSENFDLIYFDGNHSKDATLDYFEKLLSTKHNDSVWIFDDIYWSSDMAEAWEIITKHPQVTVTIDCFWLGFVFFRTEQEKENFKIRL